MCVSLLPLAANRKTRRAAILFTVISTVNDDKIIIQKKVQFKLVDMPVCVGGCVPSSFGSHLKRR